MIDKPWLKTVSIRHQVSNEEMRPLMKMNERDVPYEWEHPLALELREGLEKRNKHYHRMVVTTTVWQ